MNTGKKYSKSESTGFRWLLLPLVLMVAVIPLIVFMKEFPSHMEEFAWVSEAEAERVDFFNYYKMLGVVILSAVMTGVIIIALLVRRNMFRFTRALVPLAIYAVFVVISAIASNYSYFVLNGIREQFESVWVLLSYAVISYYTFLFVREEKDIDFLIRFIMIGAAVIAVLGVFQFLNGFTDVNLDFFRTGLGKKMITPSSYWDYVDSLEFTFVPGRVYVTLYNPNYVGMYVSLLLPSIIALLLAKKNKIERILYSLLGVSLLVCLLGSEAKNGFISLIVALFLMILIYRKVIFKNPLVLVGSLVVLVGVFVGGDLLMNHALTNGIKGIFTSQKIEHALTEIYGTEKDVTLVYNGEEFHASLEISDQGAAIICLDKDGNSVSLSQTEEGFLVPAGNEKLEDIGIFYTTIEVSEETVLPVLGFHIDNEDGQEDISDYWYFSNYVDGTGKYYMYNQSGKFTDVVSTDSALFTNNPGLFSGRGFIWAKTLPLLKDYLIIGSGPDTFEIVFPQNDYIAMRQNGYGSAVITKPHNLYLQIGVNTGVVSMIAFLAFYFAYAVGALKLIWKRTPKGYLEHMNAGILCGVTGYMVSGIINDSTVTIAPVFWCMMGLGLALNYKLKHEKQASEETKSE